MAGGKEEYRGFTIVWGTRLSMGTEFWKGEASVIFPSDGSGVSRVHSIAGELDRFNTEEDARDHIIRAAKEWIDNRLKG